MTNANVPDRNIGDMISRQAAIDAIEEVDWYHQNKNKDMVSGANSSEHQAWYKADDIYKTLEELPSAQSEQRWIPCSERLPKPFEYCLWTTTDGRVVYHHCDGLFSNYVAWMPLPEPYKEEQE